jgi:hypothetical protein
MNQYSPKMIMMASGVGLIVGGGAWLVKNKLFPEDSNSVYELKTDQPNEEPTFEPVPVQSVPEATQISTLGIPEPTEPTQEQNIPTAEPVATQEQNIPTAEPEPTQEQNIPTAEPVATQEQNIPIAEPEPNQQNGTSSTNQPTSGGTRRSKKKRPSRKRVNQCKHCKNK